MPDLSFRCAFALREIGYASKVPIPQCRKTVV